MPEQRYLAHKKALVQNAFENANIEIAADETVACPPHSRRRVTFTARRAEGKIQLGFLERRSHHLVHVTECAVALPDIVETLPVLRDLAGTLLQGISEAQFTVTACENGHDLGITVAESLPETITADLVRLLARSPFIRSSINGEIVHEIEKPLVEFDGIAVALPPAGFLQAVKSAETVMTELVETHLKKSKRVADLFCGVGTFTLPLARRARMHAVEVSAPATESLKSVSGTSGLKQITIENRDLFELPLTSSELSHFDGVCLDPPRAGALAQVKEIASSVISRVAYVSCNPETLARDAKILVNGGYRLERVAPVDQFVFSDHVEAVALFSKKTEKAKRSIFR